MSSPEENKITPEENNEEFSTIFSAPANHNDAAPKKNPILLKLISALLVLCIIAGAAVAVIKLIPEKQDEPQNDITFNVINIDSANVEKVVLSNTSGETTFLSETVKNADSSEINWYISGVNKELTDSSAIEGAVSAAAKIEAIKQVSGTDADFGLDKPQATAKIAAKNSVFEDFTLTIGNSAPAGLGYYCKISNKDGIYLASSDLTKLTTCAALDFATTTGVSGVPKTENNADCFDSTGIIKFDYMKLSGKNYPGDLRIEVQTDDSINSYFPFKITSPSLRIAEETAVGTLLEIMHSGVSSAGAYCFEPNAAQLQKYRLDNPDITFEISVKGEVYSIKASKVDETHFAVIDNNLNMIHKIAASSLSFASGRGTDYYSSFIILENLSGLSAFKADFSDGRSYKFDTVYNQEDESYKAYFGGTELDINSFKAFYQQFIGLSPVEYDSKQLTDSALKITLVHSAGTKDTVLEFKQYSAQRYQVEMDGIPMGLITTTVYDKFAANIKNIAEGKPILE